MNNANKKKKQNAVRRVTLANPFTSKWPEIDVNKEKEFIDQFLSVQNKLSESGKAKRFGLVCGLNAVSRSLEKDKLSAVLLASEAKSPHLAEHLIPLCAAKNVPVIALHSLDATIAKNMKITTLLALGITKEAKILCYEKIISTINSLTEHQIDSSICKAVTPLELTHIPPPPVFINNQPKQSSELGTDISTNELNSADFFSLKHGTFPCPNYPSELNTLSIKIIDPSRTLKDLEVGEPVNIKGVKRKEFEQLNIKNAKKPLLVQTQLKQTFSTKNGKKKRLRKNKKAKL